MESYVDVTSTAFQAIVAVAVVFTSGYALNGREGTTLGISLMSLSRRVLLPCLMFTTFASSTMLRWKLLIMLWPILVITIASHAISLGFAVLVFRFGGMQSFIVEMLIFNDVAAYPLLLVYALYRLSPSSNVGGLAHLEWRGMDTSNIVAARLVFYILVNFVVISFARSLFSMVIARLIPAVHSRKPETLIDESVDALVAEESPAVDIEEATERTPLVASTTFPTTSSSTWTTMSWSSRISSQLSPLTVATILGLLLGLIKPVQRLLIGTETDQKNGTWLWQSVGSGLSLLGLAFAVIELIAVGACVRAGERKKVSEGPIPPALGIVLLVTFWRYICMPLMTISIVRGFRKIPSTHAYIQDPAFSFILSLSTVSPPSLDLSTQLLPFRSAIHFYIMYVTVITSLAISAAIAISGHGVSFDTRFDFVRALKSAGGGGIAGAAAMVVQVLTLMPMRTIMNYQYRFGGGIRSATLALWNDGGFKRYYAGLGAALFQGPLARFGDTAANAGIFALFDSLTWPVLVKTIGASFCSACFRMTLTPIDTLKTTQQTQGGVAGLKLLKERIQIQGIGSLWYGALATAAATFVGNYPWFGTYNLLSDVLPPPHSVFQKLARQAFIGFIASVVSDTISNSLRVVKTYRQVHEGDVGYLQAAREIVANEGLLGLFGRGLPTRLLTNGLQGLLFSILWKLFADLLAGKDKGT